MEPVIAANTKFSLDLLKQLCQKSKDNVLFSPLSISSALGLVLLGAKGETADQMYKVLQFFKETIIYHDLYEAINQGGKNRKLKLYNRMFGDRTIDFLDGYLDKCEEWCFAGIRNVDFKTNPEAARAQINTWVKNKTKVDCKPDADQKCDPYKNSIENLLGKEDVSKDSVLALISVMHFEARWAQSFEPLHTNKDKAQNGQMMQTTQIFPLGEIPDADSKMLEIPYENSDVSFLIILPNQNDGLPKLLDSMTHEKILMWTQSHWMTPTEVTVDMPIFQLKEKYDLEEAMKALGMTDVFGDSCDLSGMASGKLKLSKVVHGCSVNVDEKGINADTGNGGVVKSLCCKVPTNRFVADRPFLFFIRHNPTKSILFWGRFNPQGPVN
uniref:serpin peptidase inhibitor, clade B (ovalbumin), member 5, like n=1 Tax=Danio rerio TaxID=7955 RepID=UPI0000243194|nr:serpin peptidase inhibitor, clade B (ovalbumin), member 5, like [Danio rerio]AAH66740.1 Serpin peptidase inhibitor, clade B (ovalbumin), member 5, like [Danio rerio]